MTQPPPQITAIWYDNDAGCAIWRCGCGDDATGYAHVGEARYAAAEHQLPEQVQRELEDARSIEEWREAVQIEADEASAEDPAAWRWYRDTASA